MEKKTTQLQVRLPPSLASAAKKKAAQLDRPLSEVLRDLLRAWVSAQA